MASVAAITDCECHNNSFKFHYYQDEGTGCKSVVAKRGEEQRSMSEHESCQTVMAVMRCYERGGCDARTVFDI
jgi:hypothetical protein